MSDRADSEPTMHEFLTGLARRAGALLLNYYRSDALRSEEKGPWDLVTEADRASERLITDAIRSRFPDHEVLGEESGRSGTASGWLWLVDPLDGTLNFSRGLHTWGVSVALARDNDVLYGAFYDPVHDELFYAERGRGATLNGHRLRTSQCRELGQAVVFCSVSHGPAAEITQRNVQRLWNHVMRLRMTGSVGSALSGLAAGRMDAAIEIRGGAWDHAAGGLLVREAGGCTSTFDGRPLDAEATTVLAASTADLHRSLRELLA